MTDITAIDITKVAANIFVGAGTSKIVHTIIKNNVEPEKTLEKIEIAAGSLVLGMMLKDATKKYTSSKIDHYVAIFNRFKDASKEKKENPEKTAE